MFVNYVRDSVRSSPINLAAGRGLLGIWVVWKTIWYDWIRLVNAPYDELSSSHYAWAVPESVPWLLTVEKWFLIAMVLLFIAGYRIRVTGFLSALVLAHLGVIRSILVSSGEASSLFIGSLMILFFTLYAGQDQLSIDGVRRAYRRSPDELTRQIVSTDSDRYKLSAMQLSMWLIALLFFSTGFSKVIDGNGVGFVAPDNLTRLVLVRSYVYPWFDLQLLIVEYPILGVLGGIGTLVLELGLVVSAVTGVGFSVFVLGLIAFTLSNVALLGIFFVDNLFFLGTFAAFDRVVQRLQRDQPLTVAFEPQNHFTLLTVYLVRLLDAGQTLTYQTMSSHLKARAQTDGGYPEKERNEQNTAMCVIDEETAYQGYEAFVKLLGQFVFFVPIVWIMQLDMTRDFISRSGALDSSRKAETDRNYRQSP